MKFTLAFLIKQLFFLAICPLPLWTAQMAGLNVAFTALSVVNMVFVVLALIIMISIAVGLSMFGFEPLSPETIEAMKKSANASLPRRIGSYTTQAIIVGSMVSLSLINLAIAYGLLFFTCMVVRSITKGVPE